jgi:hypothetical protein
MSAVPAAQLIQKEKGEQSAQIEGSAKEQTGAG